MSQRAKRGGKGKGARQESVVAAATGGNTTVGDAASRKITQAPSVPLNPGQDEQVSPPSIPSSLEGGKLTREQLEEQLGQIDDSQTPQPTEEELQKAAADLEAAAGAAEGEQTESLLQELQSQVDQQAPQDDVPVGADTKPQQTHGEGGIIENATPGWKKATAEKEEEDVSDEKKDEAPQGLAKASPNFQELKPKAEASEEDQEKSLADNKVDEVDLSEE